MISTSGILSSRKTCVGLVVAAALLAPVPSVHAQPTPVINVVMYGVDQGTNMLLRYEFATDTFETIGVVRDQFGDEVEDLEGLAWIPSGDHKGLWAVANYHDLQNTHLVRINNLDATAEIWDIGLHDTVGLTPREKAPGKWELWAVSKPDDNGDGCYCMWKIEPGTGGTTKVLDLSRGYEGLADGAPDGKFYAVWHDDLYTIDPVTGDEEKIGNSFIDDLEALEMGYGDFSPAIDATPDADLAWTADGALWGFSDREDALVIFNPITAEAAQINCSFQTLDCEGLVFLTKLSDSNEPIINGCD